MTGQKRLLAISIFIALCFGRLPGQRTLEESHYDVRAQQVFPYVFGTSAFYLGGQVVRRNSDGPDLQDLMNLDREQIWFFDRGATDNFSKAADRASDVLLFSSFSLPLFCYISGEVGDEGLAMGVMLFESILLADGITNMIKGATKRYRPFTYNPAVDVDEKLKSSARLSFVSGHTSISASMTFLCARILTHLHPDSGLNPYIWGTAIVFPAVTGYLRYRAGKHFPTDVIGGYLVGMGVGLLVPNLHHNENVRVGPTPHGIGVTVALY